ncbi:MAG: hypothetical protein DMD89_15540 [Candidatus Rokuibacteriota bacterium]|nr:MAG: hypothetical protein DMD89_15540 [Candidatus Rokubacteria bacterium]
MSFARSAGRAGSKRITGELIAAAAHDRAQRASMNVSEYRDDDSRLATSSQTLAKFIQICASQNDLFALDEDGNIYQYDFNAKTWGKLVASRSMDSREPA